MLRRPFRGPDACRQLAHEEHKTDGAGEGVDVEDRDCREGLVNWSVGSQRGSCPVLAAMLSRCPPDLLTLLTLVLWRSRTGPGAGRATLPAPLSLAHPARSVPGQARLAHARPPGRRAAGPPGRGLGSRREGGLAHPPLSHPLPHPRHTPCGTPWQGLGLVDGPGPGPKRPGRASPETSRAPLPAPWRAVSIPGQPLKTKLHRVTRRNQMNRCSDNKKREF